MSAPPGDVTRLLNALRDGQQNALNELLPLVYKELRVIAANHLRRERSGHTLQPTALINEAYLQLIKQPNPRFDDRAQFFALASTQMRNLLIDHARKRKSLKRGGGNQAIALDQIAIAAEEQPKEFLALNEALDRVSSFDPERTRMLEMHYFGGMTYKEIAAVYDKDAKTIQRAVDFIESKLRSALSLRNGNGSAALGADLPNI
jgi:RNA polymerase sigma factor (TIGR02999 family)